MTDEFQYFVLSKVISENMVMVILKYSDAEIVNE